MSQLTNSAGFSFCGLDTIRRISVCLVAAFFLAAVVLNSYASESDWMQYGGHEGGGRYSALTQINKDNVHKLEVAWTFKTGHLDRIPEKLSFLKHLVGFQVTPIILFFKIFLALIMLTSFCPRWQPSALSFLASSGLSLTRNLTLYFLQIFLIFFPILSLLIFDSFFNLN